MTLKSVNVAHKTRAAWPLKFVCLYLINSVMVWCKYCGSNRFKDINGLNQHQSRHQTCSKLKELEEGKLFTPKGHESESEEENEDELLHLNDDHYPPN